MRMGVAVAAAVVLLAWSAAAQAPQPPAAPPAARLRARPGGAAPRQSRSRLSPRLRRRLRPLGVGRQYANLNATWGNVPAMGNQAGGAAKDVFDSAGGVARTTAEATKGAADMTLGYRRSLGRLSMARIVIGRERCTVAPNGAPDCRVAADTLCRANGYNTGSSVDFETAEECPPTR